MTRTKSFDASVQIAVRIPADLVADADTIAREFSTEDVPLTRSDALRMALRLGMRRIAEEHGYALSSDDPPDP